MNLRIVSAAMKTPLRMILRLEWSKPSTMGVFSIILRMVGMSLLIVILSLDHLEMSAYFPPAQVMTKVPRYKQPDPFEHICSMRLMKSLRSLSDLRAVTYSWLDLLYITALRSRFARSHSNSGVRHLSN